MMAIVPPAAALLAAEEAPPDAAGAASPPPPPPQAVRLSRTAPAKAERRTRRLCMAVPFGGAARGVTPWLGTANPPYGAGWGRRGWRGAGGGRGGWGLVAACGLRIADGAPGGAPTLDDLLDLVDGHREDDHRTRDDLLPERGNADDHQTVGEEPDHESPDDRPPDRAPAAGERRATDHHSGDGVELVELPEVRGRGADVGHLQDADQSGAEARDHIDPGLHPLDRHPGELSGPFVAAGGVEPAPERRPGQQDGEEHREEDHHPRRDGQSERPAGEDVE